MNKNAKKLERKAAKAHAKALKSGNPKDKARAEKLAKRAAAARRRAEAAKERSSKFSELCPNRIKTMIPVGCNPFKAAAPLKAVFKATSSRKTLALPGPTSKPGRKKSNKN